MSVELVIGDYEQRITKQMERSLTPNAMKRLGDLALRLIKDRVRQGYGVRKPRGRPHKLKDLKRKTIERRKRITLSPFTYPSKSNATMSGRMVGGLRVTTRTGLIKIEATGTARNGSDNKDVLAGYSRVRPFLNLSNDEVKQLADFYKAQILDLTRL